MDEKFILYWALRSLNKGYYLFCPDPSSWYQWLEGCTNVCYVTEKMIDNGWIKLVDEDEPYYTITDEGRKVFEEGDRAYKKFHWLTKVLGRTGLFKVKWDIGGEQRTRTPSP